MSETIYRKIGSSIHSAIKTLISSLSRFLEAFPERYRVCWSFVAAVRVLYDCQINPLRSAIHGIKAFVLLGHADGDGHGTCGHHHRSCDFAALPIFVR